MFALLIDLGADHARERSLRAAARFLSLVCGSHFLSALPIDWLHQRSDNPTVGERSCRNEHFDVLIVGAGLSGIGAGYHLQEKCPGKRYVILEGRDCIGGTWDLFRYPGIRSD